MAYAALTKGLIANNYDKVELIGKVEEWDRELILKSWAKAADVGVI